MHSTLSAFSDDADHSDRPDPTSTASPAPSRAFHSEGMDCPFRQLETSRSADRADSRLLLGGVLGGLARGLGLDVFSESLLSRRAALEMKYAACLLSIVALFELAAWTLLFNSIFQSDLLLFNGTTLLAVIPALLFAGAVLIYERQLMTTDFRPDGNQGRGRWVVPIALRLMVILASALITAQPIELLVFRAQIEAREHEEGIRREVVTRRQELLKAQDEEARNRQELRQVQTGELLLRGDRRLAEDELNLKEQRERGPEVRQRLETAQGSVNYWDAEMRRRQKKLDALRAGPLLAAGERTAEISSLEAAIGEARRHRSAWTGRRDRARIDKEVQEERVKNLEAGIASIAEDASLQREVFSVAGAGARDAASTTQARLFEWIRHLRSIPPSSGGRILEPQSSAAIAASTELSPELIDRLVYQPPSYGFFEKLRVLDDLRRGYPARWPGLESAESQELARSYGLQDVRPCASQMLETGPAPSLDPRCDPEAWNRHEHQRAQFNRSYWVVFGIALVIPLLVIATKLLMTGELAAYYSAAYQAAAGQREAVELKRSRMRVQAESNGLSAGRY